MRRFFTSVATGLLTLTFLLITVPTANAQATGRSASATATASDTLTAADTTLAPPDRPGRVRISIGESGISVEGEGRGQDDASTDKSGEWVEIRDDRGPYREKGVDIVKFGKSVFVAADEIVRGDLVIFGGNAIIEGRVTGNVFVIGGNIRARSGAEIKGDAMVIGGVLDEDEDVIIHGERILFDDVNWSIPGIFNQNPWFRWVAIPVTLFIKLVLAFLVVLFLRDRVLVGDGHLGSNFLKSFGTGILTAIVGLFALLIVMIPLIITVIGIPLAILLVVSCVGVFIIAWTIFAYSLGQLVSQRMNLQSSNPFMFVFVGAVILFLPDAISFVLGLAPGTPIAPVGLAFKGLGMLLSLFGYLSGLGAIVLSRFGSRPVALPIVDAPLTPGAGAGTGTV